MSVESAKDRLSAVYDYLRYVKIVSSQKDFAAKIGINKASMSSAMNGEEKYLTTGLFGRIHNKFPQFNKVWLLTGEGEMLCNGVVSGNIVQNNQHGDNIAGKEVTVDKTESQLFDIIKTKDEQIDRLLSIIEKMNRI